MCFFFLCLGYTPLDTQLRVIANGVSTSKCIVMELLERYCEVLLMKQVNENSIKIATYCHLYKNNDDQ